jgi:tRNA(Ile)-lysidine synthase
MPQLAREGLDARRLSVLARRLRRVDAAVEAEVARVMAAQATEGEGGTAIPAVVFSRVPEEIALRLLGRAIARHGDEGPVELGKLEALLAAALPAAEKAENGSFRRSLAGALVTIAKGVVLVEKAPPRRGKARRAVLTTPARQPKAKGKSR